MSVTETLEGTVYGEWKITIAETGTGLQSGPPKSKFEISESDILEVKHKVDWGAEEFSLEDFSDALRPHLIKRTVNPVVKIDGKDCRALFGLLRTNPDELEVVVEELAVAAEPSGSARGQR